MMRIPAAFLLLLAGLPIANALTPLPDNSPGFFAGEWAGAAGQGGYCYLALEVDGSGVVLIDGGSGDWLGARVQWHNEHQSLQVDKVIPLAFSAQRRVMPLQAVAVHTELNQSLNLSWGTGPASCQLQKIDAMARQLERARQAVQALPPGASKP
jgi:hypothetical protein